MNSNQDSMPRQWKQEWAASPIIQGVWFDVKPEDADEMLQVLVSSVAKTHLPNILAEATVQRVRAMPTPFYSGWLLAECQIALKGKTQALFCFLLGPDGAILFDGRAPIIHALNSHLQINFTNSAIAAQYLFFFCNLVRSDLGRFEVVETINDLNFQSGVDKKQRTKIAKHIQPLSKGKKGKNGIQFDATIRYGDTLFKTNFTVQPHGMVEMVEDDPLLEELPINMENFEGPFRIPTKVSK